MLLEMYRHIQRWVWNPQNKLASNTTPINPFSARIKCDRTVKLYIFASIQYQIHSRRHDKLRRIVVNIQSI